MKIAIVVQARCGSTRLPGKVLRPLAGAPALLRMLERVAAAQTPATLVVATTTAPEDEAIVTLCRRAGVRCMRGHPTDLLDRHVQAARAVQADVVVKIPSDCPLICPKVIDAVLQAYLRTPDACDYFGNLHPPSYPDGQDVEVMPLAALEVAWAEAKRPLEREHTTPFLWERPARFRLGSWRWPRGLDLSMSHRWTLDYPEDYDFIAAVYERLYRPDAPIFSLDDVLVLLAREPELMQINAHLAGVNWYRHHLDELRTIAPEQSRAYS